MERTAHCHCGSLRVITTGEPERVYLCHCRACQRRTGTAFHFGATYLKERVRLGGDRKIFERDADSGYRIRFHFCTNCGTTPLLGRRPQPRSLRSCRRWIRHCGLSGPRRLDLGGIDVPVAWPADGHGTSPTGPTAGRYCGLMKGSVFRRQPRPQAPWQRISRRS